MLMSRGHVFCSHVREVTEDPTREDLLGYLQCGLSVACESCRKELIWSRLDLLADANGNLTLNPDNICLFLFKLKLYLQSCMVFEKGIAETITTDFTGICCDGTKKPFLSMYMQLASDAENSSIQDNQLASASEPTCIRSCQRRHPTLWPAHWMASFLTNAVRGSSKLVVLLVICTRL
jgi:hypothetical protein